MSATETRLIGFHIILLSGATSVLYLLSVPSASSSQIPKLFANNKGIIFISIVRILCRGEKRGDSQFDYVMMTYEIQR